MCDLYRTLEGLCVRAALGGNELVDLRPERYILYARDAECDAGKNR
jgi:hypothetical protein